MFRENRTIKLKSLALKFKSLVAYFMSNVAICFVVFLFPGVWLHSPGLEASMERGLLGRTSAGGSSGKWDRTLAVQIYELPD